MLEKGRDVVRGMPLFGEIAYHFMHSVKAGIKDALSPQLLFTDLGLKYVGPVDGHDEHAVEAALRHARGFGGPVLVHVVTRKGMGYAPAEDDEAEQMHSCGVIDPVTGLATKIAGPGWTATFSDALIGYAKKRRDIVAITAAMPGPTGLTAFGERFPDRLFDVGIAEQHAMTSAAGLAMGGMHPVVAIYSTFLNRAFDQIMMDVALHKLPVTIVLDRAGVTGSDGASHNGMWDLSMLGIVPGIRVAAPRDGARLREELGEALDIDDGPTAIRFPKGDVGEDIPALERAVGRVDVLAVPAEGLSADVLLVAVGAFAPMALAVAERLHNQGIGVTVIDPRWVLPVSDGVLELAAQHKLVVTLEDNGVDGGVGSAVSAALRRAEIDVPCRDVGLPQQFFDHASRGEVLADAGLTDQDVARRITGWVAALGSCGVRGGDPRAPRLAVGSSASASASGGCSARGQHGDHEFALPGPRLAGAQKLVDRRDGVWRGLPVPAQPPHQVGRDQVLRRHPHPLRQLPQRRAGRIQPRGGLRFAPAQRAGGGGPLGGSASSGGSGFPGPLAARANHIAALRRWLRPPNTGNATRSSRVFGSAVAASMMAESGRMRRGAMSRRWAMSSRVSPQFAHRGQAAPVAHLMDARRSSPAVPSGRGVIASRSPQSEDSRIPLRPNRFCLARPALPRSPRAAR